MDARELSARFRPAVPGDPVAIDLDLGGVDGILPGVGLPVGAVYRTGRKATDTLVEPGNAPVLDQLFDPDLRVDVLAARHGPD